MPRKKREPVDLCEIYGPEAAHAFKSHVGNFFEWLEASGNMPDRPKQADTLPPPKARHSTPEA